MKIEEGVTVELDYVLESPEGEVLEESEADDPLVIVFGTGELPDSVEEALAGHAAGDEIRVALGPEELFGPYDPAGIFQVEPEVFPDDAELEIGMSVTLDVEGDDDETSGEIEANIVEVRPDAIVLDSNHPLAGRELVMRATIRSVVREEE